MRRSVVEGCQGGCQKENEGADHGDARGWPVFLDRARGQVQVDVDRVRDLERVLRTHLRYVQIVRMALNPAERELAALFNDLRGPRSALVPAATMDARSLTSPRLPVSFS